MNQPFSSWVSGKKVLILGLGVQGGGAGDANFLYHAGAVVRVNDLKTESQLGESLTALEPGIDLRVGQQSHEDIDWSDVIVRNPGVPWENELITYALDSGKTVVMSTSSYVKFSSLPVIGITGTRGKSTTTHLVYHILSQAYPGKILLGGNVPGVSTLSLLDKEEGNKYTVLELSSWQLQGFAHEGVSPHIALITNLFEDHLNRYSGMGEYIKDKFRITAHQTNKDSLFLNSDNELLRKQEFSTQAQVKWFSTAKTPAFDSLLVGDHNQENIAAAYAICHYIGIADDVIAAAIASFKPLSFRLEKVAVHEGRVFVNDTTSTTPTATIKAINAIKDPMVLILGGASKNLSIGDLLETIASSAHLKKVVILGSAKIPELLSGLVAACPQKIVSQAFSMKEAVDLAYTASSPGDTILLSPGFASFDLFTNEFDRGRQFNSVVEELAHAQTG